MAMPSSLPALRLPDRCSLKPHQPVASLPVCFPRSSPVLALCTPENTPIRKHVQARQRAQVGTAVATEISNTSSLSGEPAPSLQDLVSTLLRKRACRERAQREMLLTRRHCGDESSARRRLANVQRPANTAIMAGSAQVKKVSKERKSH